MGYRLVCDEKAGSGLGDTLIGRSDRLLPIRKGRIWEQGSGLCIPGGLFLSRGGRETFWQFLQEGNCANECV